MLITRWNIETNPKSIRRLGKLGEELGEASAVSNRCMIQGIDQIDPSSGKTNRERLENELADVMAQVECSISHFNLDRKRMIERAADKIEQMVEWESFFD